MYNDSTFIENSKDTGPWKVFAIIGMIASIFALILGPISLFYALLSDYNAYAWYIIEYNEPLIAYSYIFFAAIEIGYGLSLGGIGLVLSVLGKKSTKQKSKAKKGIIFSSIGLALNILALVIMILNIIIATSSLMI